MTNTKILQTVLPENENDGVQFQLQFEDVPTLNELESQKDNDSDDDSRYSSSSSSDNNESKNENGITCNHCGQIFISKYYHD